MTQIYLENGELDLFRQDIEWEWQTVRFSEGLRDQFTTDITIPKNDNNLYLLDAAGLLDRTQQPLGGVLSPCTLSTGQKQIDAYIEVVSTTEDDITICVYERTIENTTLKKWFVDDYNSIFVWNVNTVNAYPNWFKKYQYGMGYDWNYAQYHPSMNLNDLIDQWAQRSGFSIPHGDPKHKIIATNKYVCPQNGKQFIEGHWTSESGEYAVLTGGQHITNDCEFSYSPSSTTITFNRKCKVNLKCYYAWEKKSIVTNSFFFTVSRHTNGTPNHVLLCQMESSNYANHFQTATLNNIQFEEGSTLFVRCNTSYLEKYNTLNFVLSLEISDYDIYEEDYNIELQYVGRTPRLLIPSNDKKYKRINTGYWQEYSDYQYLYFDGGTLYYHYNRTGHPNEHLSDFAVSEWGSFAYFGFYCNLNDIELREFLFGMCWLDKKKLVKQPVIDNYALYNACKFVNCDDNAVIEGVIKETVISSDKLGKHNYILQAGEKQETPISDIDNIWLQENVVLHQSPFTYTPKKLGLWGCIDQYSKPEHDEDTDEYKCEFNEVEGLCIMDTGSVQTMMYQPHLSTMDFDKMTQSISVKIETTSLLVDTLDYVYLDGRKYFICSGTTDLNTNISNLECVLAPTQDINE